MKPTVGRIVHFREYKNRGDWLAAIVTGIDEFMPHEIEDDNQVRVSVSVFHPNRGGPTWGACIRHESYADENAPCWRWPPREGL